MKVIADAGDDAILGVHIVGAHAADIVHEAAVAMQHKVDRFGPGRAPYTPTPRCLKPSWRRPWTFHGEAIHAPPKKK